MNFNKMHEIRIDMVVFVFLLILFLLNSCSVANQKSGPTKNKTELQSTRCPNSYYYEDFSNVQEGSFPEGWIGGESLSVISRGQEQVLSAIKHKMNNNFIKYSFIIPRIDFPEDFQLEIGMVVEGRSGPFIFSLGELRFSIRRNSFRVKGEKRGTWEESYEGTLGNSEFNIRTGRRFNAYAGEAMPIAQQSIKLKKKGSIFTLYVNNQQIALTRRSNFENPTVLDFRTSNKRAFAIQKISVCDIFTGSPSQSNTSLSKNKSLKAAAATFFYEDFLNVENGLMPEGWKGGDIFAVSESQKFKGKKVFATIGDGKQSFTIPNIDFPEDFKLEFQIIITKECCGIMVLEIGQLEIVINTNGKSKLGNKVFRVLTNEHIANKTGKPILPTREIFLLTLTKQRSFFNLLINGRKVASTRIHDFRKPQSITFTSGKGPKRNINFGIYKIVGKYFE